jgi:hypothetical protein
MSFLGAARLDFSRSVERHSTKKVVSCCLLHNRVIIPFFLNKTTVELKSYLDMLENYACTYLLQAQEVWGFVITFQEGGALPHWTNDVTKYINQVFQGRWLGCDGSTDET